MLAYRAQLSKINAGVILRAGKSCNKRLRSRLACAVGKRRKRGIHNVHPCLNSLKICHISYSAGIMRMQVNRYIYALLKARYQIVCIIRQQKICHILNANGVSTHVHHTRCQLHKIFGSVNRTFRIAYGTFRNAIMLLACLDGALDISKIIKRIKNTDNVYAVINGTLYKLIHYIIGIMLVSKQILSTQQHLKLRIGQCLAKLTQTVPRIFVQKAEAGVKCSPSPAFQRIISHFIKLIANRKHLIQPHSCCSLRLMRVSEDRICN